MIRALVRLLDWAEVHPWWSVLLAVLVGLSPLLWALVGNFFCYGLLRGPAG